MAEDTKIPEEWAKMKAPYGRTKSGRPRKRSVRNPTGKRGPSKGKGKTTTGRGKHANVDQRTWRQKMQGRRIKFDDDQKAIFCEHLAETQLMGESAEMANTTLETVNRHREADPDFDEQVDASLVKFRDKVIGHHTKCVFEGEVTERLKDGEVVERVYKILTPLVLAEIKKQDPGYRDKQIIDLNTEGGVLIAPAGMSVEEFVERETKLNESRLSPDDPDFDKTDIT